MKITMDSIDLTEKIKDYARLVGETSEQATVRYGVATARNLAQFTEPKKSSVKSRKLSAITTMLRVCTPRPTRLINRLKSGKEQRARFGRLWFNVDPSRIVDSANELWNIIENHREGKDGNTRYLAPQNKYFCKDSDFNKVVRKRALLWGAAKGAWIGAGKAVSRFQSGLSRIDIGRNFISWAHKHTDKGTGSVTGKGHKTVITLTNKTAGGASERGLSKSDTDLALSVARRSVLKYYAAEMRRLKIKKGGK